MEIYFYFIAYISLLAFLYDIFGSKAVLGIIIISSSLFVGLRYNTGTDYVSYVSKYLNFSDYQDRYEPLFVLVTNSLVSLELPVFVFFLVFAFITNFLSFTVLSKLSNSLLLSLTIFLGTDIFFRQMNQVRQVAAISIIFFAFRSMLTNRRITSLVGILVGGAIHYPSLLVSPFIFLARIKFTKLMLLLILVLSGIISSGLLPINYLVEGFTGLVSSRYLRLVTNSPYSYDGLRIYFELLCALIFVLNLPDSYSSNLKVRVVTNILVFGIALQTVLCLTPSIVRLARYLTSFQAIALPVLISSSKLSSLSKIVVGLGVALYYLILTALLLIKGKHGVVPYNFYFVF